MAGGGEATADLAPRGRACITTSKRRIQRRVWLLELIQQPLEAASRKVFDLRKFLLVLAATGLVLVLPTPLASRLKATAPSLSLCLPA